MLGPSPVWWCTQEREFLGISEECSWWKWGAAVQQAMELGLPKGLGSAAPQRWWQLKSRDGTTWVGQQITLAVINAGIYFGKGAPALTGMFVDTGAMSFPSPTARDAPSSSLPLLSPSATCDVHSGVPRAPSSAAELDWHPPGSWKLPGIGAGAGNPGE